MRALVVYSSKYGSAGDVAGRIAGLLGDADLFDLEGDGVPSLAGYGCVVAGSAIYAGQVRKGLKAFLAGNEAALLERDLGLFVCGLSKEEADKVFEGNFSAELLAAADAVAFLGGRFDPAKANFAERLVMKALTKSSDGVDTIDDAAIARFVEELKES